MAFRSYWIYVETPVGTPLGDSITDIRPWLDRRKIEPVEFQSEIKGGIITLDIHFRSPDEAQRFERDFALL